MECRGIIDPVAHIADHISGLLECMNDRLFMVRLHLSEDIYLIDTVEQRLIAHLVKISTRKDFRIRESHLVADIGRNQRVVPRDNLQ